MTVKEAEQSVLQAKAGSNVMTKPIYSGTPIRSAPRLLKAWHEERRVAELAGLLGLESRD